MENKIMRKYTAIFTNKRKEVVKHFYAAKGHKAALEEAKKLEGWPNVVITDEAHTSVPGYGYGNMIYMNGIILENSGGYDTQSNGNIDTLFERLSAYDAATAHLRYASIRISHIVHPIKDKPSKVKFIHEIAYEINKLASKCRREAEERDEPCWYL